MLLADKTYREQGRPTKLERIKNRYYARGQACMALKMLGPMTSVELAKRIGVSVMGLRKLLDPCPLIKFERRPHEYVCARAGADGKAYVSRKTIMVYRYVGE